MKRGFTLIEVMVAAAILAIGCLGVLAMMLTTIEFNAVSHDRTNAVFLAEQELSRLEVLAENVNNWDANGAFAAQVASGNVAISNSWQYMAPATGVTYPSNYQVVVRQHDPDSGVAAIENTFFGELRVIWSTTGESCGGEADTLVNFDSLSTAKSTNYAHCAFVTLPFVLSKP